MHIGAASTLNDPTGQSAAASGNVGAGGAVLVPFNAPSSVDFEQALRAVGIGAASTPPNAAQGVSGAWPPSNAAQTPGAIAAGSNAWGSGPWPAGVGMQASAGTLVAGAAGTLVAASAALRMPFQPPAPVTQPFGPTSLTLEPSYAGYAHFHTGIDFGVPRGTPITAAGAGTVVSAGWDASGFGNRVLIDHGNGVRTLYGHLERVDVAPGEAVQAGDQIGLAGSTGNSSGPHLHFAVEQNGRWVDPTPYLVAGVDQGTSVAGMFGPAVSSSSAQGAPSPAVDTVPPGDSTPGSVSALIRQVSLATGVPESMISSVVQVESGGNPGAESPAGAKGLMQLMDSTASSYGVTNALDPAQNLLAGAMYLRSLLQRYNGDEQLALAAYNAGPGAVDRYGGVPPYAETRRYVRQVEALQRAYAAGNGP